MHLVLTENPDHKMRNQHGRKAIGYGEVTADIYISCRKIEKERLGLGQHTGFVYLYVYRNIQRVFPVLNQLICRD